MIRGINDPNDDFRCFKCKKGRLEETYFIEYKDGARIPLCRGCAISNFTKLLNCTVPKGRTVWMARL